MGRAPCCEKVGLKRGRWTCEEDEILRKYIETNGEGSWRSLPKNAGLLRCGKSCRLRWINYLRSDLKRGNFSSQEEDIIINLHASLGNRWSLIAGHLAGRTDNEIKNYWNSHLSRKIHSFRRPNPKFVPPAVVAKRAGRRSSRKSKKSDGPKTTPIGEKEKETHVVIPDSSPHEEGIMESLGSEERVSRDALMVPMCCGMEDGGLCVDDMMEDLVGIWGLEKEVMDYSGEEESWPGISNQETGPHVGNINNNNSRDVEQEESGNGNSSCFSFMASSSPGDSREWWRWGEEEEEDNTFSWLWDSQI